jgi:hypothetical protein
LILVTASCVAPAASGEIFKCATKDGTPLYQNFPCQFDSIGWLPPSPQTTQATQGTQATRTTQPTAKSANPSEPRIGMTAEEVKALLGEPEETVEDEPGKGSRVSIWRYADGRSVQFDNKQRVLGVQR